MGGVVHQRPHRGLQELSSLADTGRTLLGPAKASKFIVGDGGGESELVRSARRLLGALDLSSAAGQLLWEAVEAQHGAHHAGTGTLLLLAGAWSRAAQECLRLGVPGPVLAAAMSEGLGACLREVSALQVPLRRLSPYGTCSAAPCTPRAAPGTWGLFLEDESRDAACPPERPGRALQVAGAGALLAETRPQHLALTHSRHFARTRGLPGACAASPPQTPACLGLSDEASAPDCEGPADLAELEAGLSHGDPGSMQLVDAVARWQWLRARVQPGSSPAAFVLDLSKVFTCCLPGFPESSSYVCPGFVTAVPLSHMALVVALQAQPVRVVLLEGDLTESYRHLGFCGPACRSTVLAGAEGPWDSLEEQWVDQVLQLLATFSVNLVLAQGHVSEHLLERAVPCGCLVLGSVSGRAMQALAGASGAVPLAYITQVEECCVGTGLRVALTESVPGDAMERTGRAAITLQAEESPLVTVVLASPVPAQLPAREDGFWACAHRLSQALRDGHVSLGGGAMELLCLCHLHELARTPPREDAQHCPPQLASSLALYRSTVLEGLARGWHSYLCTLSVNSVTHLSELDAGACIQRHVWEAVESGAPATYVARLSGQLGCGAVSAGPTGQPGRAPRVFDVATPKVEAWRRALDLVLLVLQTDCEVITGLGPTQISSQESKDLLFL